MALEQSALNFVELHEEEAIKKLEVFAKNHAEVIVWEKGGQAKEQYLVDSFNKNLKMIVLENKSKLKTQLDGIEVLVNFALKGNLFFSRGLCSFIKDQNNFTLRLKGPLFKCQRRHNFRLDVRTDQKCWIHFKLIDLQPPASVVTDLKGVTPLKIVEKEIFKQFNEIVSRDLKSEQDGEYFKFKILDISVSGIAFILNEKELPFFSTNKEFHSFVIGWDTTAFQIPKGKVVYVSKYKENQDTQLVIYKVGLEYVGLPAVIDKRLAKKINQCMRFDELNTDFEKYLDE